MPHINVISHRGANKYAPQNTLPAFEKAVSIGVDGFETDVHITKDEQLVLCHNYTIDETSDGKGHISKMTLDELKRYDFGRYFSDRYAGTRIPTVDEFLSFVETADISVLNIELKSPKENETAIVSETIRLVKEHNLFDKLLISSFDPKLLVEAKQIDENCKTGLLYSPDKKTVYKERLLSRPVDFAKSIGADALHPHNIFVDKRYVLQAHEAGLMVNPWTVDSVRAIEKMIVCGVDGIITNFPDVVNGLIEKHTY
ncbi:MAG: glycerophosphodiester phosphodiesterase [Faecalibacterium sp.]|nr:glycerophosphodiester phosphodiesterase [Ruminococcus sp.]MCM1392472.1 glycerophosphodiester phosphodiesterase [Ruminococcus sp.]MCM1486205.1 glycerophosphodiester phosphodiesterase [Faecalibacterium sp.]